MTPVRGSAERCPAGKIYCQPHSLFVGVAFFVEQDKAFDPVHVGLLSAIGIMLRTQRITYLVEELFGRLLFHGVPHMPRGYRSRTFE